MMLTSHEIRKKFLDFFAAREHAIIASDSVVPKDDPTVLFTTAGMQQFKRQFLGYVGDYTRAASSQKCLRTDDLDKVGKTDFHHTFFEMLGNFSFGDYFKKDAIAWAWEFLTKELKIPTGKLWISVYTDDEEAAQIWLKDIRIDPAKLVRLGDKSNFWPAEAKEKGPNGPCGPCSEIFYDYGVNPKCTNKKCDPDCNCGRFSEIWNLVFTQFDRKEGGVLEPLPNKNIDTGMGLERLVAVVQGKKSNYETDIFVPIIVSIENEIRKSRYFPDLTDYKKFVVADHIRAIVFAIADGVIPSNEGRGYVVRKLIIDSADLLQGGVKEPLIYQFVHAVILSMGEAYPEIVLKEQEVSEVIKKVEEAYVLVQIRRMPEFRNELMIIKNKMSNKEQAAEEIGKLMFLYRDTHGLTVPVILSSVRAAGFSESIESGANAEFNQLMEEQQSRSRAGSKMTGDVFANMLFNSAVADTPPTEFVYDQMKIEARVLKLFSKKTAGEELLHVYPDSGEVRIILDKTPFYAESGGQIGDTGYLTYSFNEKKATVRIFDTQKQDGIYIHIGRVENGTLYQGVKVIAQVDEERRLSIMRHHTATHLLQAALREVLGKHVQQQGSLVAEDRLRFDFSHPKAISKEELKRIEGRVNEHVAAGIPVRKEVLGIEEAKKKGALAFFAEKYGDKVRVVSIGDVSKEFCGGTHLKNTSEIGIFKIASEGAVAQGIRRLEAKTGKEAELFIREKEDMERANAELAKAKQMEAEQEKARYHTIIKSLDPEIKSSPEVAGTKIFKKVINGVKVDTLKSISDFVKQAAKSSAVILGSKTNGTATIVVAVTDDLVRRGISARDIVREIAPLIDGSGGGAPQMAQAGSKRVEKIEEAVRSAGKLIVELLHKSI